MSENVIEVVEITDVTPMRHQLGKLMFATLVSFAATAISEKVYDVALAAYRRRHV
jgi:hypothetical protein